MKKITWLFCLLAGVLLLVFCHQENKAVSADIQIRELPRIALTFDDGPNKIYTPQLLDGLKKRGITASFFITGENIEGNEELVLRMKKEGHLIGNHTYSHVCLGKISSAQAREEIEKASNRIYEVTGEYPEFMRPPYGEWRQDLELFVDMFPVFWDVDTLDWKNRNVKQILSAAEDQVKENSIILMHDSYGTSVEAALQMVDRLRAQGYQFVTVDRLLLV